MKIKELREAKGLYQSQVADALGVSQAAVAKWEAGQAMPTADKLPQLALLFSVPIDAIFGREPPSDADNVAC